MICPNHKKGHKHDCNSYQEIALISVAYKVFPNYIPSRLWMKTIKTTTNEILGQIGQQ